jgi:hypothetical protein
MYLLWPFAISSNLISFSFPILITVFTLGLPSENNPEDYKFFTGFIFTGKLLNSYYLFIYSYYSSVVFEKLSAYIGWLEFLEGWGILKICFGHCPN